MKKIPIEEVIRKASRGPFVSEYNEMGGYDCMTDSFDIKQATKACSIISLDLSSYGQGRCEKASKETLEKAQADALLITHCLNNFLPLLEALKIASKNLHHETSMTEKVSAIGIVDGAIKAASEVEVPE